MTVIIHPTARISKFVDIEDSTRGTRIIIGPNVTIDSFVKIKPVGGMGDIVIEDGCYINSGCVIYSGNGVRIGKNVLVAANVTLAPTNHNYAAADIPIIRQGFMPSKNGIVIGDDVWIGANTVILDGANIGNGCVVGAASLVRSTLEPQTLYAGNPIKLLRRRL